MSCKVKSENERNMTSAKTNLHRETVSNAKRLLADAVLLKTKKRYHSSVAISVQAMEEFGKSLIMRWEVRNEGNKRRFPSHIEKQSATFALLSAHELLAKGGKRLMRLDDPEENFLTIGPLSHQFAHARAGFYENLRQSVTYRDEEPIYPTDATDKIGKTFAVEMIGYVRKAIKASAESEAMSLASEIYKNDLGRL